MIRWIKRIMGCDYYDRVDFEQLYLTPVEYEQWKVFKKMYAIRCLYRHPAIEKNLEFLRAKIHELGETAHRRRDEWSQGSREVTQSERDSLRRLVEGGLN